MRRKRGEYFDRATTAEITLVARILRHAVIENAPVGLTSTTLMWSRSRVLAAQHVSLLGSVPLLPCRDHSTKLNLDRNEETFHQDRAQGHQVFSTCSSQHHRGLLQLWFTRMCPYMLRHHMCVSSCVKQPRVFQSSHPNIVAPTICASEILARRIF